MTRRLTLLFAAFEAALVLAIGVAVPLLVATVLWAAQFGFGPDWLGFWRGAVDVWLIGHGVDVTFVLDETTAAAIAAPAGTVVKVTIAALGFALLTLALGVRAGIRIAETGHRRLGSLTSLAVFAALSFLVTFSVLHPDARPSLWQGTLLPPLVYGAGLLLGVLRESADAAPGSHRGFAARFAAVDARTRGVLRGGLTAGAASVALTLLVSAIAATVVVVVGYAQVIRMYESLHTEVLGGVVLTAGQLAFIPNVVIWAASWFAGPGFALGLGSQVSPLGTAVGPLPAIPILGALPSGELSFGFVGLVVPVVAGFLAGAAVRPGVIRAGGDGPRAGRLALTALLGALVGGLLLGLLAAASAGGLGPGRFSVIGPDPLAVGLAAAAEFAVGIGLGIATGALPGLAARLGRRRDR
ncbi:cell division protein PerM [Protaetiibacter intestinalis]|uniref:Integral membrane protein n=1 Tax=Protaetiibacter intestinalis TaxID=2419774 RepID=A0A387B6T5_9MICO|nr:DUF6350 family protein [Protaetiibacter intestinalis]AYF97481.1 hypothetical protein D7I47_03900 [Protaetiibacter intestinalis]